jgi:hypothetical protein
MHSANIARLAIALLLAVAACGGPESGLAQAVVHTIAGGKARCEAEVAAFPAQEKLAQLWGEAEVSLGQAITGPTIYDSPGGDPTLDVSLGETIEVSAGAFSGWSSHVSFGGASVEYGFGHTVQHEMHFGRRQASVRWSTIADNDCESYDGADCVYGDELFFPYECHADDVTFSYTAGVRKTTFKYSSPSLKASIAAEVLFPNENEGTIKLPWEKNDEGEVEVTVCRQGSCETNRISQDEWGRARSEIGSVSLFGDGGFRFAFAPDAVVDFARLNGEQVGLNFPVSK